MSLNIEIADIKKPRFEGEFLLVAKPEPPLTPAQIEARLTLGERDLRVCVATWMDNLDQIVLLKDGFDDLRIATRRESLDDLRELVTASIRETADLSDVLAWCHPEYGRVRGVYALRLSRIEATPFGVSLLDADDQDIPADAAMSTPAADLKIRVRDVRIDDSQKQLKLDIDRTVIVVRVALGGGRGEGWFGFLFGTRPGRIGGAGDDVERRSRYIRALRGIARLGLESREPTVIALAAKSLDSFKEEFVAQEAGRVKNRYLQKLGFLALLIVLLMTALYIWFLSFNHTMNAQGNWSGELETKLYFLRNMPLLVAGTAAGTWLSFSLRRVILTFLDLAALEEDRLDPFMRLVFVSGLAIVVGLLMWQRAITVGLGDFTPRVSDSGLSSVLLGLLLGIAERTLATAVYKRATDFGGAVGGK